MDRDRIYDFMVNILVEQFELEKETIHPEATLFDELGLDSLDMVDLAVEMQAQFGFTIERSVDEVKLRAIRTVNDLCDLAEDKIKASNIDIP
jgi:acyl carrier protein